MPDHRSPEREAAEIHSRQGAKRAGDHKDEMQDHTNPLRIVLALDRWTFFASYDCVRLVPEPEGGLNAMTSSEPTRMEADFLALSQPDLKLARATHYPTHGCLSRSRYAVDTRCDAQTKVNTGLHSLIILGWTSGTRIRTTYAIPRGCQSTVASRQSFPRCGWCEVLPPLSPRNPAWLVQSNTNLPSLLQLRNVFPRIFAGEPVYASALSIGEKEEGRREKGEDRWWVPR
ncbi:hypothetical protein C8R46DRAFT_1067771 [Mycena filopes]|nr:hypothetical protein C8R46DRAFT_1067771 [Mycena filopes]